MKVYTDGSCIHNGAEEARAGAGVWFGHNHPLNASIRVTNHQQSNQTGELLAILHALQTVPLVTPIRIISDSLYCLRGIVLHSSAWEARGWIKVANKDLFKAILSWCRARSAPTFFRWVKGHAKSIGNHHADRLAADGAQKEPAGDGDLRTIAKFLPQGAQIATISQSTIYAGIMERKSKDIRRATQDSLAQVKTAIKTTSGLTPTDTQIWKSIRSTTTGRRMRVFLWKLLHQGFHCGDWWKHIAGYEGRAVCSFCGSTDSLQHIISECNIPGQAQIWDFARQTLRRKGHEIPPISLGLIAGANLFSIHTGQQKPLVGATRLARIVLTESAYLIWKVRCERVIERDNDPREYPSQAYLTNRTWTAHMAELLYMPYRVRSACFEA
ncbi:ribonuclease H-like protein [Trametopsis cervina]|nr:ribonuclease H-like protein [Trametopsis cervina]